MTKKKRINQKKHRQDQSKPLKLSRTPWHLRNPNELLNKIHIRDVAPQKLTGGVITIKDFSKKYGSPPADILLEKLKAMGFSYMTQLDFITNDALEALSKSWGYDNFFEFDQARSLMNAFRNNRLNLEDAAAKFNLSAEDLYSKLIYRSIKAKTERLKSPIRIFNVAYGSGFAPLVLKLFKDVVGNNLTMQTEVSRKDVELFLLKVEKINWRYPKDIPNNLLPFFQEMEQEKVRIESSKFLQKAHGMEKLHLELYDQYSPLSLKELGAIFKAGINDLDDDENLILKKIINERIR
jgi:hypothetical protein